MSFLQQSHLEVGAGTCKNQGRGGEAIKQSFPFWMELHFKQRGTIRSTGVPTDPQLKFWPIQQESGEIQSEYGMAT